MSLTYVKVLVRLKATNLEVSNLRSKQEQLAEFNSALDDLFAGRFVSMQDCAELVDQKKLVKKGKWEDDYGFQAKYPDHPLASENRGKRMKAADTIRDRAMELQEPLPEEMLDRLHVALFDSSAAVRLSLAHALFYCGSKQSSSYLEKLLEKESESKLVREYAGIALERCRMQGIDQLPEGKKVIMLVSKDIQLAIALQKLAEVEGAYFYMPQYNYSELIAWSSAAAVQVIDRWLMGQENWNAFCDYLDDVNDTEIEYPIKAEDGEVLLEEPIYDHTPLIITDWHMERALKEFRDPKKPQDKLFYIEGGSDDMVTKIVEYVLKGREIDIRKLTAEINRERGGY